MNKTLAAKFLSYGNLAQFFSSNATVWDDFPILKEEVSDFFTRKLQLENSTQSASNGLQGLSNAKLAQLVHRENSLPQALRQGLRMGQENDQPCSLGHLRSHAF